MKKMVTLITACLVLTLGGCASSSHDDANHSTQHPESTTTNPPVTETAPKTETPPTTPAQEADPTHDHNHEQTPHEGHQHKGSELTYQLSIPGLLKTNVENTFFVKIMTNENKPLDKAKIKFEYWHKDQQQHTFVEAREEKEGEYQAKGTLTNSGEHHFVVHVEKEAIHDHYETTFTVQ